MSDTEETFEKQDVVVSVAVRTALFSAILFLTIHLLERSAGKDLLSYSFDAGIRIIGVALLAYAVSRWESRKPKEKPLSEGAFLSTAIFYGITVSLVYVMQIVVIAYEMVTGGSMTFLQELKFLLWVSDFSTEAIVSSLFLSHLPYVAYYLVVRKER